jgi:hypothetical protein
LRRRKREISKDEVLDLLRNLGICGILIAVDMTSITVMETSKTLML